MQSFERQIDEQLTIRLLQQSDAAELFDLVNCQRNYLSEWLPWPPMTKTVADSKAFLNGAMQQFESQTGMVCGIFYQTHLVGVVGFNEINHSLKKVKLGYWLSQEQMGKGLMTKSCRCLVDYAFETLDVEKVEIAAATDNWSSRKVCERLGADLEGIISHAENLHGRIVSHAIYSLLNPAKQSCKSC